MNVFYSNYELRKSSDRFINIHCSINDIVHSYVKEFSKAKSLKINETNRK